MKVRHKSNELKSEEFHYSEGNIRYLSSGWWHCESGVAFTDMNESAQYWLIGGTQVFGLQEGIADTTPWKQNLEIY